MAINVSFVRDVYYAHACSVMTSALKAIKGRGLYDVAMGIITNKHLVRARLPPRLNPCTRTYVH